ncbi:hypothetical protein AQUCO_04700028v1 [Aquilegia coerulea]|uniref:F-box domain-containing protein n=1 Tax=Aquilegia coerulea TaxID=218851 RepID=A0A2G5CKS6_AQUCA|nr:hypothetical protein AQUCO_04700028v1 [Aquilegia coerulea]
MNTLPSEITSLILIFLPMKYILQFRCVCKAWLLIIDSLNFAETHLSIAIKDSSTLIFFPILQHQIYIAKADETSQIIKARKVELSCTQTRLYLFASYNGLLCLSSRLYKRSEEMGCFTYVCNPCTRVSVCLPCFNSTECGKAFLVSGFGLDPLSNNYKVVQVFSQIYGNCYDRQEVQVYTLGSNSWRNLGYAPDFQFIFGLTAFVSGSCHWLAKDGVGSRIIVSFDLGREVFGVIPSPEFSFHSESDCVSFRIAKLGGCLSVADCSFEDHIEIWILKEYDEKESWIKHFVMKGEGMLWNIKCYPITIWMNSDILLMCDCEKLFSYNIVSGKSTPLKVDGLHEHPPEQGTLPYCFGVFSYVETLIPL